VGKQPHLLAKFFGQNWLDLGNFGWNWAKRNLLGKTEEKFGQKCLDLGKFDWIWAKSKSCILKSIRSPTAM